MQGYYCASHYQIAIGKELEFIDAQDEPLPTDFVVIRKRKSPADCHICNDQTRIFITRGHYEGPDVDVAGKTGLDKLTDIESEASSVETSTEEESIAEPAPESETEPVSEPIGPESSEPSPAP